MTAYQSENITELAKALLSVQQHVQFATKDAENTFSRSLYCITPLRIPLVRWRIQLVTGKYSSRGVLPESACAHNWQAWSNATNTFQSRHTCCHASW